MPHANTKTSYSVYNPSVQNKTQHNNLTHTYPNLPNKKYEIIYADPPWDYNNKLQFDNSAKAKYNPRWNKNIFTSAAKFKYPTLKLHQLKQLNISSISSTNCLLFLWSTNPHLAQAIELGMSWGFEYKTIAFVWNKMMHNPGQYTLSYCEVCLLFKKGKIPTPRGARNIKQLIEKPRTTHSKKPSEIAEYITQMFPQANRIELFARPPQKATKFIFNKPHRNWDVWGLDMLI